MKSARKQFCSCFFLFLNTSPRQNSRKSYVAHWLERVDFSTENTRQIMVVCITEMCLNRNEVNG